MQKSISISGMDTRSGFRKRSNSKLYCSGPASVVRNADRSGERVRKFAEHLGHFQGALEIELIGLKLHAMRIAHGLAGLDAEHNVLRVRVVVMQIVAIVGGDERDARLF